MTARSRQVEKKARCVLVCSQVIAIYGNEYEQVNAETELHFMKERAKYSHLEETAGDRSESQ